MHPSAGDFGIAAVQPDEPADADRTSAMQEQGWRLAGQAAAVVGDRLAPDIRFAREFGMRSALVLNGVPAPAGDAE